jgi:3-methyladenine DNA glycosylase Tag
VSQWADIWERACERHGEDALREHFPTVIDEGQLRVTADDRFLSAMSKRVFSAGFRMAVIQAKWATTEEAFHNFDVDWVATLDAEGIDALAQDTRIVRNRPKIISIVANAQFVKRISDEHDGFGNWLADWPADKTLELWAALKEGGNRLGGDTGPWFMRLVGKDTFRFSRDVSQALVDAGVVKKAPTGKKDRATAAAAIYRWSEESGLGLGAVSLVLAKSTGDIYAPR